MSSSSNIRVFVDFKEDTVFAGEDVECTITFKHVPPQKPLRQRQGSPHGQLGLARSRSNPNDSRRSSAQSSSSTARNSSLATPTTQRPVLHARSETDTSALNVVDSFETRDESSPTAGFHIADAGSQRKHGRSVSIISIGTDTSGARPRKPSITIPSRPRNHGRAASLQATPTFANQSPRTSSFGQPRSAGIRSPLSTNQPMSQEPSSIRRNGSPSSGVSPSTLSPAAQARMMSAASSPQLFKFPSNSSETSPGTTTPHANPSVIKEGTAKDLPLRRTSPRPTDETAPATTVQPQRPSLARVFPPQSIDNTPRTSVDFYSVSNHSNETLTSEQATLPTNKLLRKSNHSRSPSSWRSASPRGSDDTLMMGYAQIQGSFTLDGSLVNQGPFGEVKRKGVVGGQGGGGVVGLATPHEENGLFGGFGGLNWGTLSESLGGILKGGEPSSIKEMKGIADSKNIPLISTAKSILFVDLKLEPGQSKSYSYSFNMPRGLPPSHRGRAMKVSYSLVVGTQRPGSVRGQQQQIRQVEIPFRLFGGVNERGELLGHDLMAPYIILKDQARTASLDTDPPSATPPGARTPLKSTGSSAMDFQSYVNHLLTHPRKEHGLLSPTEDLVETPTTPSLPRASPSPLPPPTTRSLIDLAIRTSNRPTSSSQSSTNFTIARASVPIATLTLSRPALKLGDLLTCVIDFSNAKLSCYALEATLESVERVDPSLAIRSQQSIERATRRVWARAVENCVWAKRCVFPCQIPVTATPAFDTTGVSLEWSVRLEIVVAKSVGGGADGEGEDEDEEDGGDLEDDASSDSGDERAPARQAVADNVNRRARDANRRVAATGRRQPAVIAAVLAADSLSKTEQLLDEVSSDERGKVFQAAQWLPCESFEVTIPIRVFGAAAAQGGGGGGGTVAVENGTGLEGLAV